MRMRIPSPLAGEPPPAHSACGEPNAPSEAGRLPSGGHAGHQQSAVANGHGIESQERRQIGLALQHPAGMGADAAQIAKSTIAAWQEIDAVLAPLIGQRGVAALFKRSLHLTSAAHPWIVGMGEGVPTANDRAALEALLAQQDSARVAAAGSALVHTFRALLATLVGPSLTERLLGPVWIHASNVPPAQETSP